MHADRIVNLLARMPGLDDDQIARELAIEPRQTVNQVCRRLAERGQIVRERDSNGKLVNRLPNADLLPTRDDRDVAQEVAEDVPAYTTRLPRRSLVPCDLTKTLLVIPCSKEKERLGTAETGTSVFQSLPFPLAEELLRARQLVKEKIGIDERTLLPARYRYHGKLYRAAGKTLDDLREVGAHILILSGGYGLVLATELIGYYDAALNLSWWPHGILERCFIAYAQHHGISSVRAFASETGPYTKLLRRVLWRKADVKDALLIVPQGGSSHTSPASQGEAIRALHDGALTTHWRSSYGLPLRIDEG
jgi:hypothetical protein